MFVPDKLKLNKFRQVSIPSPAEYVSRFGLQSSCSSYSGDDDAPMPERKLDVLHKVGNSDSYSRFVEERSVIQESASQEFVSQESASSD